MIITITRKPLVDSVCNTARLHHCGAINVDGTRISHNEECKMLKAQHDKETMTGGGKYQQAGRWEDKLELKPNGRWPANVLLSHLGNCNSEIEVWNCTEGCPIAIMDSQSGIQKSGVAGSKSRAWGAGGEVVLSSSSDGVGWKAYDSESYGDVGGASRYFKTIIED